VKLYNTRTHSVDEFAPLQDNLARIYSCGPTVYNHAHIGNLVAYIASDTLHRVLKLAGYDVKRVMNFTDVDDKTVRDSRAKYPELEPMEALTKFTRHWEEIFRREMNEIGNNTDEIQFERATENIDGMKNLIKFLLDQGIAYVSDDGVYFNIAEYRKTRVYGQLSHIDAPDESRARIDNDEYDKESAQDFALWKKEKPGEPVWDFEIDGVDLRGRPGWHIECSVMSVKGLGQPFDIHTGGVDHIFPHHENEIAQSTAGDQPELYANFFVHNEFLLVDGKKMAKSDHNFYTLPDIIAKGFSPLDFRMLTLQSHYRSATNVSWENLTAAHNRLKNWRNVTELRHQTNDSRGDGQTEIVNNLLDKAKTALLDDIDTPNALKYLDEAFNQLTPENLSHFALENLIRFVDNNLGLEIAETTPDISDEVKKMLTDRAAARAAKDWAKSDELRDKLAEQNVEIKDSAVGQIWVRK
jgi:cysteinyl-tRNA synthetase